MTQTGATQREELDREWLDDFIERWEAAWNAHEPERLLELMTEDSCTTTPRGRGRCVVMPMYASSSSSLGGRSRTSAST